MSIKNQNILFLGEGETEIISNQFSGRKDLVDVIIANTVQRIGAGAFYNCTNLRSMQFEEGSQLRYLDNSVFQNCNSLKKINFPDTLEHIHSHCFWNCLNLPRHIDMPVNLRFVEATAFFNTKVQSVSLPQLCRYQGYDKGFPFQPSFPVGCKIIGGISSDFYPNLNCPLPEIEAYPETCVENEIIPNNYYSERKDIFEITIPKTVKVIGASAFYFCSNLKSVIFESGSQLKYIDYFVFQNCMSLENIIFSEGLRQIRAHSFWACRSLKTVEFPQSLEVIDASAFFTSGLTHVILPANCKYQAMGHAFPYEASFPENCVIEGGIPYDFYEGRPIPVPAYNIDNHDIYLSSVYQEQDFIVPAGTKRIENNQFSGRDDLTHIRIPKSVEVIGAGAFYLCKNLKSIDFEEGSLLKSIDHYAFQNCFSLEANVI